MTKHRIYTTSIASVYPHYIAKAAKKGRSKSEVDEVIRWLTGYGQKELDAELESRTDFETFFEKAPGMNPARASIKGVVCGVRLEDIEAAIQDSLKELMRDKTVIAIAHRLSTIRSADQILVLDDGRIVERGTHDALMANRGLYRNLYERQYGLVTDLFINPGEEPKTTAAEALQG